jgi:hypothetical protein
MPVKAAMLMDLDPLHAASIRSSEEREKRRL